MDLLYALPCLLVSVLLRISSFMIIILYPFISCLSTCILFHQSPALILSYHEFFLLDIICCISTCSCILVLTTRFSMHIYDLDLSILICLSQHAIRFWHHHSPGSSDSSGSSCPGPGTWSMSELGTCRFSQLLIRVAQW